MIRRWIACGLAALRRPAPALGVGVCVGAAATVAAARLSSPGDPLLLLLGAAAAPIAVVVTSALVTMVADTSLPTGRHRPRGRRSPSASAGPSPKADEALRRRIRHLIDDPASTTTVFQPIVDLRTGTIAGVEALTRFPAEPGRPPNEVFDTAAGVDMRVELELEVFERAFAYRNDVPGEYLAINLSPAALVSPAFVELLDRHTASLAGLVVELTEPAPATQYGSLLEVVGRLRSLGGRLAVDDSGTGYSNFSRLLDLRPDLIKIDRRIVHGALTDPAGRALLNTAAEFAADIGATVIAEGVERDADVRAIRAAGIALAQGFLFGRPGPLPIVLPPSPTPTRVLRVLIADQDALVRTLLARLVRRCGYAVVAQASDGDEILDYAASERPDVVILDLTLPQLNVRRALPTLRAQLPHAHILVLSADAATKQNEPTLRDLGADQYIAKDFAITRLPIILASLASDPTPRMSGGAAPSSATPLSDSSQSGSDTVGNRAP